ncbi:hypothetical protein HPG69_006389 [Diceros bicornis minor]|uniref:MHC class I-like antigen recognition-like domain-containing protein n=1 Tax=Diceros bicornis minor TaxID=77932 RepID=A0A7J7EWH0_DICBM|nr:hypothetical protein HPG69_006389 [Diceros bicornis minor]
MLFLQLPLLAVLLPGGDNKDDSEFPLSGTFLSPFSLLLNISFCPHCICSFATEFQGTVSIQIIQISSFYNRSWVQTLGSGWLGELQTHGWGSNSGTIFFLWPWPKGNFSSEEWMELEKLFHMSSIGNLQAFHDHASQRQLEYPFEVQITAGCELHFREASVGFMQVAYEGSDFFSFQNIGVAISKGWNKARGLAVHWPQSWSWPSEAGLSHVWLLIKTDLGDDEQEHAGTQRSDILPNADGTWYLLVSLDFEATEAAGLSCRMRHSSLGGQYIILYWEHHSSMGLTFLAVRVPLVLLTALAFWFRKRWELRMGAQGKENVQRDLGQVAAAAHVSYEREQRSGEEAWQRQTGREEGEQKQMEEEDGGGRQQENEAPDGDGSKEERPSSSVIVVYLLCARAGQQLGNEEVVPALRVGEQIQPQTPLKTVEQRKVYKGAFQISFEKGGSFVPNSEKI